MGRGRTYSRQELLDSAWGRDHESYPRTVDVHIRWLREKLEDDPASPRYLLTVRGQGYRFAMATMAAGPVAEALTDR